MALSIDNCAAAILAGGESRRMGTCKSLLPLGRETMIARLTRQLIDFPELWISANDPAVAQGLPGQMVQDRWPGLGPLAGLGAVLSVTEKEFVFCISCDLAFFSKELAEAMLADFSPETLAMACVDATGRIHPLCGIYAKAALPIVEHRLANGQLRMLDCLESLHFKAYQIAPHFPDVILENINTPEAYARVLAMERGGQS